MLQLAQPADREAINAMARQVHAMHVAWRPDIYEMVEEMYSQERFQQAVQARQLYAAKIGGTVAGYTLVKIRNFDWTGVVRRRVMFIDEFCVEEAMRGHGIGTAMMEDIKALGRAFGCTDIQLSVYPQNDAAVTFYQKCGLAIQNISMQCKL